MIETSGGFFSSCDFLTLFLFNLNEFFLLTE